MRFLTCGLGITVLFSMALIGHCAGAQPSPAAPPLVQKAPLPEPESQPVVSLVQPTGTAADVVAPELIQLLADPNWEKRIWAADHLGKLGPEAKVAVPASWRAQRWRTGGAAGRRRCLGAAWSSGGEGCP